MSESPRVKWKSITNLAKHPQPSVLRECVALGLEVGGVPARVDRACARVHYACAWVRYACAWVRYACAWGRAAVCMWALATAALPTQMAHAAQGSGGVSASKIDPVALLKSVREAQASIKQTLQGKLRKGSREVSYRMVMEGPQVRFEFPNATPPAPMLVVLRFGEKSSTLAVGGPAGMSERVNFSDEIPGMGVCYEDLSLRFLYWPDAVLEGEESLMLAKCWKIRVRRPASVRSPYAEVLVWVSQSDAAFLKSESYSEGGELLKRMTVRSVQSLEGVTALKQLRIEAPATDKTPTYLDVDGQAAPRPMKK